MSTAKKRQPEPSLADNIRAAAEAQSLGVEAFRRKHGFSNGTFYDLLSGELPGTRRVLKKLALAGVQIPAHILGS